MVDLIYKSANQQSMLFHAKKPLGAIQMKAVDCIVTVWAHGKNCEAKREFAFHIEQNGFVLVAGYRRTN